MENTYNMQEFNFKSIFASFKKYIILILVITILAGALGWAYATFVATPMYSSYATMYVYNSDEINHEEKENVTYNELYAAQVLTGPYMVVLQSERLLGEVAKAMGDVVTVEQLKSGLTVSTVEETVVLYISFTSADPTFSQEVIRNITKVFPDEIRRVKIGGGAEVIDEASTPKMTYPIVSRFILLSAIIAFMVSSIVIIFASRMNGKISDETDFEAEFSVPLLGTVPKIEFEKERTGKADV